ncbi:MAG TPA: diguanylate cyclase [Thermoleophilaceae bacterium]|nr:diguanylate cyclase [Thermoleophilaceae bacterium]
MAVAVAGAYFTIAVVIVPRIELANANRRFATLFRLGAVAFFIGCGLTHMHIATHAMISGEAVAAHEAAFHVMQVTGGWMFVFAALRMLDIQVSRRARPSAAELERLARLALRDELTGTWNRRFMEGQVAREASRGSRSGTPLSMLALDIDNFKLVNDASGHAAGDQVLLDVTSAVSGAIRPSDTLARVGGDEFQVLLPETDQLEALIVAERARKAVRSHPRLESRRVTVTVGAATLPGDATTPGDLWSSADQALYWAKRCGKNLCASASEVVVSGESGHGPELAAPLYPLVDTLDSEPLHTRDHSQNVAYYAIAIGTALGLEPRRMLRLRRAAFFHDIGKLRVPPETLAKDTLLTDQDWDEIRQHPAIGAAILSHAGLATEAAWVRQHHERYDGGGYPEGIAGGAISLEARIIFVADAFEAMTAKRPYQDARPSEEAVAELRRCSGSQFDPEIVEVFCDLVERRAVVALASV